MDSQPSEAFIETVRAVLRHLYRPVELRQSVLIPLLGLERRPNPALALQELMISAIEDLHPQDHVPPQADSWRIYHVLSYRHVEQSSQPAVAATLALSVRQLRRLERMAEQTLSGHLWRRYHLDARIRAPNGKVAQEIEPNRGAEETPDLDEELAWLHASFPNESGELATIILGIRETVAPLIRERGIQFRSEIAVGAPTVSGQLVALRQGLLNVITAAMHAVASGSINLRLTYDRSSIQINVQADDDAYTPWAMNGRVIDHLQMARRFINLFGGSLDTRPNHTDDRHFSATVHLLLDESLPVLVIDDNADTLRLVERYLTGTRYRYFGATNPDVALSLAEEIVPAAIVMDVMLPGIDDWELLGRLRAHPDLYEVPVIVCTILPQEELALALGAAAYLRKPVSREALRDALDRQVSLPLRGPG